MGFFSSRKVEDNSNYLATAAADDKSVVHVIRSRFVRFFLSSNTLSSCEITKCIHFTCSTARIKAKNAKASQQLRLRHMVPRSRRRCQTPRPERHMPPALSEGLLIPRRKPGHPFYAARMIAQRCLHCQPRQEVHMPRAWARPLPRFLRLDLATAHLLLTTMAHLLPTTTIPLLPCHPHPRAVDQLTPPRTSMQLHLWIKYEINYNVLG